MIDEQDVKQLRGILARTVALSDDEHGSDTPERWLSMMREMTSCSPDWTDETHMKNCIKWKTFKKHTDELITIADIPFTSLCNHHMVPFMGKVHIGYVPHQEEAGLSKFPRVVGHFSRQLQVQERLTKHIADFLDYHLQPKGVAVVVRAEHMCMTIRGVKAPGTLTTTSAMRGVFADHAKTAKAEFMATVNNGGKH